MKGRRLGLPISHGQERGALAYRKYQQYERHEGICEMMTLTELRSSVLFRRRTPVIESPTIDALTADDNALLREVGFDDNEGPHFVSR
jgi:hypothetical protein